MTEKNRPAEAVLVDLGWNVPVDGYEVVTSALEKPIFGREEQAGAAEPQRQPAARIYREPWIIGRTPMGLEFQARRYDPLAYNPMATRDPKTGDPRPRLFRSFCDLEPTPENILNFANQCGLLVGTSPVTPPGRKEVFAGEPLSLWSREVTDMNLAFDLWNALLEGNEERLKLHIHFVKVKGGFVAKCRRETPGGGKGKSGSLFNVVDTSAQRSGRVIHLKEGDFRLAAIFAIQDLIRKRLTEHVGVSVLYRPERDNLGGGDRVEGSNPMRLLPLGLRMLPRNLLGTLWLQLAQEIERGTEYRRCAMCPRRMEISLEGHRRNRTTCSDKCRQALQRSREDKARTMRGRRMPLRAIARALGTTEALVKKWSAKPKRPRGRPRKHA